MNESALSSISKGYMLIDFTGQVAVVTGAGRVSRAPQPIMGTD